MFAADGPLLDVFWTMIVLFVWVMNARPGMAERRAGELARPFVRFGSRIAEDGGAAAPAIWAPG
jgi:hypothetical protein